jgi:hypothetical protein
MRSVAENTRLILRADHRQQRNERDIELQYTVFRSDAAQQGAEYAAFVLD